MASLEILTQREAVVDWLLAELENRRERGWRPVAVLACTFTFDSEVWEEVLAKMHEAMGLDEEDAGRMPTDVVCDKRFYKGHKAGYDVRRWAGSQLFHPKLIMVLYEDEVLWVDGSFNLTHWGLRKNREIALCHMPGDTSLPKELRLLLSRLPKSTAAEVIHGLTINARTAALPGRYFSSVAGPIGPRALAKYKGRATEIHVMAPFVGQEEEGQHAFDGAWLDRLAVEHPTATFHFYLPKISETPPTVQGDKALFVELQARLRSGRLYIHPVGQGDGPLHAKLLALVIPRKRSVRCRILVGSPNMTSAALTKRKGNIETAWSFQQYWESVRSFLGKVAEKAVPLNKLRFKAPRISAKATWNALAEATYDRTTRELRVIWEDKKRFPPARTIIRYRGKTLTPLKGDLIKPFVMSDELASLETVDREGRAQSAFCPIVLDDQNAPDFCGDDDAEEMSPDEWLETLGALRRHNDHRKKPVKTRDGSKTEAGSFSNSFDASEKVRGLAAKIRYVEDKLFKEPPAPGKEWANRLKLLRDVFAAQRDDPKAGDRVWRFWVRYEFWRLAQRMSTCGQISLDCRREIRGLAGGWRRQLGAKRLPGNSGSLARRLLT